MGHAGPAPRGADSGKSAEVAHAEHGCARKRLVRCWLGRVFRTWTRVLERNTQVGVLTTSVECDRSGGDGKVLRGAEYLPGSSGESGCRGLQ
jgi:hypothetical protein